MAREFKRKLTTIFSADVAGYSRLMGENEAATVKTLEQYKRIMAELIGQHRGRVVDSPGDNLLAEFASVVDAVQCGVAIQKELQARNADLPENRRMRFRIGINLGDVIEEGERIYGDGVNIAARLEAVADPGGICVSKTAFDHIETKLPLGYQFLGGQTVKNIAKPVEAYKVLMEPRVLMEAETKKESWCWKEIAKGKRTIIGLMLAVVVVLGAMATWQFVFSPKEIEKADPEKMAFPLPEKPSIAVLPFSNLSENPNQEHFVDGMTEEVITTLSKISGLFVVASNSVFAYKAKPVKIQQVSQDLSVRYVLEGSVRRSGERVRITAQLIDAVTGHHLWAERYDRVLQDIFAVQDDITQQIVTALEVRLTEGEQARLRRQTTSNVEAWERYSKGLTQSRMVTKEGNTEARRLLESAVELDPQFAAAWALLGHTYMLDAWVGWTSAPSQALDRAVELARKAIDIDGSLGEAHMTLGAVHLLRRQHDEAIAESERAVALNPNSATIRVYLGRALTFSGRPEEAIEQVKKAMRLSPVFPDYFYSFLGQAYRASGRYTEALSAYQRWFESYTGERPWGFNIALAITYGLLGRETDARSALSEALQREPTLSIKHVRNILLYANRSDLDRELTVLRQLGLPETPSPVPDKPSIAVLPFVNMSDDPQQQFFADGIAEEIINALSKLSQVCVTARNSSFTYRGKTVDVRQIGSDLRVRYILEGSVRRDRQRVRVTAQLIDAASGQQLFSERYDRELKELFATQDEITIAIVRALRVTVTSGEQARLTGRGTKNLDAYLKAIQANEQFFLMNRQGSIKAKELAREAISLDSLYAFPYAVLANSHMLDVFLGFSHSPDQSLKLADDAARQALSLDDSDPYIHSTLTNIYVMQRQYDRAIASAERALILGPGAARSHNSMGTALFFSCRFNEAIPFYEEAIRLDPYPTSTLLRSLGGAYSYIGRQEEALKKYEMALKLNPEDVFVHLGLAALYIELGQPDQAAAEAREVLRIHPQFSLDRFSKTLTFKETSFVDRRVELIRKAGLK